MPKTILESNAFQVGWICALSTEFVAACELLDEEYAVKDLDFKSDENSYIFGCIGHHKVVIACLPKGRYGLTSAASVARDMMRSFPSIRFGLMVGIGGGAPSNKHDIRLGDIVVGCPSGTSGGVINIQYGKNIQGSGFTHTGSLAAPPRVLLTALNNLIAQHERNGHKIQDTVGRILANPRLADRYRSPGWDHDHLFSSKYLHRKDEQDCEDCCFGKRAMLARRTPRPLGTDNPIIHYGIIASADSLMKNAEMRNKLAKTMDVLCFEMEAAGLVDHFPCLVIRGICDYSDTHKNKRWQCYAAAVAAAYAKELLTIVPINTLVQQSVCKSPRKYHGLFALSSSQSSGTLTVVAVHGLGGDAVATWKTSEGYFWLRDWLSKHADVCVLTYGYDSAVTWSGKKSSICDTALDLLKTLRRKRSTGNLVFLCHGLGGVIVRIALALSLTLPDHAYLHDKLSGLIFLGTPQSHLHSHEWMRIVYRMSNVLLTGQPCRMAIMEKVEELSDALNTLSFEYQFDTSRLAILSYYETVPILDTGSILVESEAVIVESARELVIPLKANHMAMAAPDRATLNDQHEPYTSIGALIADMTSDEKSFTTNAELLQKLYCVDYELYSVNVPDASPKTGTWLWTQDSFKTWASSQKSLLFWVTGPPGYGKTVIAKTFTRDLKTGTDIHPGLQNLHGSTIIAFFFREEKTTSTSTVVFLRSLLHQLLLQHPALGLQIQQAFDAADSVPRARGQTIEPYLSQQALWSALRSVLHNTLLKKVVLVVDALDEAAATDLRDMCYELLRTLDLVPSHNTFKIFLTSRNDRFIYKQLSLDTRVHTFDIMPEDTSKDIAIFLDNVISAFAEEHHVSQEARDRVKEEITQKAEGMFLWASLAWDYFKGGVAVWSQGIIQERLAHLETLPPGLGQLYVNLLQKIDQGILQGLHAIFYVVAAAARPLTCEEAEQMLGIKGRETRTTDLDVPFSIRATIETHCSNLLKISPAGVIRTVHLSLKDFLRGTVLKQVASALHSKIARDCIHYLTLADVREEAQRDVLRSRTESCLMTRFAFYDYAASYLHHHMEYVGADDLVWLQYASMKSHQGVTYVAASAVHEEHVNTGVLRWSWRFETPLRHAIRLHGAALIQAFASAGYNLDEKISGTFRNYSDSGEDYRVIIVDDGTAIHANIGNLPVVSELLSCGASPNIQDCYQRTPLHAAALNGSSSTMKLLLSVSDMNINAQDVEGRTALHYEASSARGSLLLNDPRVDVNIRDKGGRTAVTTAAFWGDHKTTIEFLRSPRNSLAQHEGELSILIAAAQQDWLDVTLDVLNQLPDVSNHRAYDGRTILHLAVLNDWEVVLLKAVMQGRAKVNDVDKRKRTPLHEAAELGNHKLARKLISYGASARYRDHQGRTPIQLAAIEGFSDTVLAMMDSDFDVNDADHQQRTIVHWAASWDWSMIMRRVIEVPEANLLKHDQNGRTALHIAALCGCPNVLELLVEEDIFNVNEADSFGNSLLHLAARAGSASVVAIILRTSNFLRTHSVNKYGQTALDVAVTYGKEEVEEQLRQVPLRTQKEPKHDGKLYYSNMSRAEPDYHTEWTIEHIIVDRADDAEIWSSGHRRIYKCHTDNLLPQTLEHYALPWEIDESDNNYIIVKQEMSYREMERLWDHSRELKEQQQATAAKSTRESRGPSSRR